MPRIRKEKQGACFASLSRPEIPQQLLQSVQTSFGSISTAGLGEFVLRVGDAMHSVLDKAGAPANTASTAAATAIMPASASPSARLRAALAQGSSMYNWGAAVLPLGGLLGAAGNLLSPTGPGGCDHNALERCANCATSVPYVMVGVHAMKHRQTSAGKVWGASMCGVGVASTCFHASSGKWRTLGRRLDYWSIALSSTLLTRAVYPNVPSAVTAAGLALTPFKPFLVSFLNSAAMELKFLQRAQKDEKLRRTQQVHAASCLLGLGAFILEDFMPELPLVHSAWHCLSAVSVSTVNHLLHDVERSHGLGATQRSLKPAAPAPLALMAA